MVMTVSLGRPYTRSFCSIFPMCMESNALKKSTNEIVASRFFAQTPSKIQQIFRIGDVVNQFL